MKKSKKYLLLGLIMIIIAIIFICCALRNPEGSFPRPLEFTYLIYLTYIILMIYLIIEGLKTRS